MIKKFIKKWYNWIKIKLR